MNRIFYPRKRSLNLLVLLCFGLFFNLSTQASHIAGGSIKYKSLGSNQYWIEVALFRDCKGIQHTQFNAQVTATCISSGTTTNLQLPHLPFVAPTPVFGGPYSAISFTTFGGNTFSVEEVSDVCDQVLDPSRGQVTNCRVRNGAIEGYTRFKFGGIVTLTPCNYWRLGYSPPPARNLNGSNINSGNMYVETRFNSLGFPSNSAPDFADEVKPIPSACVGLEVKYGVGTIDHDGDSLRFEVACAQSALNTCVNYRSGFTALAPADSFTLDAATGLIRFVPKTAGKRVVAFWVKEYERCTGAWKAQTLRDVQFRVESCNNNVPKDLTGITNIQVYKDTSIITGNKVKRVKKLGSHKLQVCNGTKFSWDVFVSDPDTTDTLVFNTNVATVLPGAGMTVTKLSRNTANVRFTWKASIGKNPVKVFYMVFNDDQCNYPGNGFSVFEIEVRNSTDAGEDTAICLGVDTIQLEASGGRLYQWKSVWGDSLIWSGPNRNVWGDTTAQDTNKRLRFFPSQTTYLEVWSDMKEGCIAASACQDRDSIKITAAKNYELLTHNDTTICYHDSSIEVFSKPDSAHFSYTYKWTSESEDTSIFSNDSINNPIVTLTKSQYLYIDVESDSGCSKKDSIYVRVTKPMPQSIVATTLNDPACAGVPAKIDLSLGRLPSSCGATTQQCVGAKLFQSSTSTTNSNGNGTSGTANWPCPYGGAQASARQQFIYTANELRQMGITSGTIEGIGFNVVGLNGVGNLDKYTIKLKCLPVNDSTLNSFIVTGLTTVFTAKQVTPTVGWNNHTLDVNYDYDGRSNLLVDICWENANNNTTSNAAVAYVPTTHNSAVGYMSSAGACNSQFLGFTSRTNRPTLQLSFCGARDTSEFTYSWTPATGLNSDTILGPTATITQTTKYLAQVTDTSGKCSDTTSITLNVANIDAGPDTSMCPNDTIQLFPNFTTSCKGKGLFKWTPSQYFPNDSVQNPLVSVPQTTMVTVTYSDSCGCTLMDSLTIYADSVKFDHVMYNPPCGTSQGAIKFNPTGGFPTYTFSYDSGSTWTTLDSIPNLGVGEYHLMMRDSLSCLSEVVIDTLFNGTAPRIDSLAGMNISCGGFSDGAVEVFTIGGIPPLQYSVDSGLTWVSNSRISGLEAGEYIVYVRGRFGCASFPSRITLTQPDSLDIDFNTFRDSCYNQGHGFASVKANGGTLPYNYTWSGQRGGAPHSPVQVGNEQYTRLFAYNQYKLKLTDANGCGLDTTFTIEETPELEVDSIGQIQTTCNGYEDGKIYIRAKGGNPADSLHNWVYRFSIDGGSSFYPYTGGLGREDVAIIDSSSVPVIGTKSKIGAGNYSVVVIDGKGCKGQASIQVVEPSKVELTSNVDSVRICVSTCTKLEVFGTGGNSNNHNFHWTPTVSNSNVANVCPDGDMIYSVYATDNRGCSSEGIIIRVDLFDSLSTEMNPDTSICDGAFAQLNVLAHGGDGLGYNYLWQPFENLSNAFIQNPVASPDEEKVFVVKVSDNCGSPAVYDSVRIKILPQPVVDFSSDVAAGCPPLYAKFDNLSSNGQTCHWQFGDGTQVETCAEVYKTYTQSGKYDVMLKVTSADGCVDSLVRKNYMDIYPVPRASFSVSPEKASVLNSDISFHDESDGRIVEWNWNFAGFDTSMQRNTHFLFPDNKGESYPVKLIVTNDKGCVDDTIRVLDIDPTYSLYVPSSFTPNGDGKNDVWQPIGTGIESDYFHVMVFDRWGELVFESHNIEEAWDGTNGDSEEIAPVGNYTWRIITGDALDEKNRHEEFGYVALIK